MGVMGMYRWEKALWIVGGTVLAAFIALQFFPIWEFIPSMDPRNPPVKYEVQWASAEADEIMHTVCYTCHSNETEYPIYTRIAPVSWIASEHVTEGREHLNFSEQPLQDIHLGKLISYIQSDRMPPEAYRLVHPEANLTEQQKADLIAGIRATMEQTVTTAMNGEG